MCPLRGPMGLFLSPLARAGNPDAHAIPILKTRLLLGRKARRKEDIYGENKIMEWTKEDLDRESEELQPKSEEEMIVKRGKARATRELQSCEDQSGSIE